MGDNYSEQILIDALQAIQGHGPAAVAAYHKKHRWISGVPVTSNAMKKTAREGLEKYRKETAT